MHAEPDTNDPDTEDQHVCQSVGEFNEEAFRYIVGYVQKKLVQRFPQLEIPVGIENPDGWVESLSRGKLTVPNQDLIEICRDLNQAFQAFHGDLINKEPRPLEKLLNKVLLRQEKNQMYAYVCELFLKVRFFNRIKFLNVKLRENESAEKIRRCKQQMQHLY